MKNKICFCLFFLTISYASGRVGKCQDENVSLDGQAHSTIAAGTAAACQTACDSSQCKHWAWKNGQCTVLRVADPGKKIGVQGAVSGVKNGTSCTVQTTGVQCHYTQSRDPVVCLFPWFGEVPGGSSSSSQHQGCLKTKRGKFWCATKISLSNQLLATSDQTQDVDCGLATSKQGVFRCLPPSSCPSMVSVQQRIADLERNNRELEDELSSGVCRSTTAQGAGWGTWSTWSKCSKTCNGEKIRTRSCPKGNKCTGSKTKETQTCGGSCGSAPPATKGPSAASCTGRCGKMAGIGQCQCTETCFSFGDCCSDYSSTCSVKNPSSCEGKCGTPFARSNSCQCNLDCAKFKNCCTDFSKFCSSSSSSSSRPSRPVSSGFSGASPAPGSDPALGKLTEKLLVLDENNAMSRITLNTGCTSRVGSQRDCSSSPLFTSVDTSIFRKPVYAKLMAMYENYDPDVTKVEDNSRAERAEESDFINEIMRTMVMKETLTFLKANKYFTKSEADFKKLLKELWFGVYSRGMRILGSSGFEHVFLGEKKAGKVQGFHNWVYFYHLEKKGKLNYLGHWENVDFGGKGTGLSFTFKWGEEQKPFASMLVGTSPELEMAIYTTCLLVKSENKCVVSLAGKKVEIEVHVFSRPRGVRYIASSFMDF